jgi:hypothetical protein
MTCSECVRLLAERERLEEVTAAAIRSLFAGPLPGYEFGKLKADVDRARLDLEAARLVLEGHERMHVTDTVASV